MRVLLTSTGLETKSINEKFIHMLKKDTKNVKALFIPTAANYPQAIEVLPKCMNDLLACGILTKNVEVFDLHTGMSLENLEQFDVVYLCGGDPKYLLERINDTGFHQTFIEYIKKNGLVLGVSAGSIVFANNYEDNLGLIPVPMDVHCEEGTPKGKVQFSKHDRIRLTNTSALVIEDGVVIL